MVLQALKLDKLKGVFKVVCGPYHSMALADDPYKDDRVIPIDMTEY